MDAELIRKAAEAVIEDWEAYSRTHPCDVNRLETLVPYGLGVGWTSLFKLREALQARA